MLRLLDTRRLVAPAVELAEVRSIHPKALYMLNSHMLRLVDSQEPYFFTVPRYPFNFGKVVFDMYMGWYDPDKKKSLDKKLDDAIQRYIRKHEKPPTVALVSTSDYPGITQRDDLNIQPAGHIAKDVFFVGSDEA